MPKTLEGQQRSCVFRTSPYSPSLRDALRTGILRQALASPNGRRGDAARTGLRHVKIVQSVQDLKTYPRTGGKSTPEKP